MSNFDDFNDGTDEMELLPLPPTEDKVDDVVMFAVSKVTDKDPIGPQEFANTIFVLLCAVVKLSAVANVVDIEPMKKQLQLLWDDVEVPTMSKGGKC